MAARKKVHPKIEANVLLNCARRCCLCFHLEDDFRVKLGQIAHLDQNPSNGLEDNLGFLCFDHHTQYDSTTRQNKNFTLLEVKQARANLHDAVRARKAKWTLTVEGDLNPQNPAQLDTLLIALRELLKDENISLLKAQAGSIQLNVESSVATAIKASYLHEQGQLTHLAGNKVVSLQSSEEWNEEHSGRNIVLCLDGTSDFAAKNPTHVFRLFRALKRSGSQVIYYDGGVGTLKDAKTFSKIRKWFGQTMDAAAGASIADNFMEAYRFLVEHYREGDRIYLFGFSRGAYTARALAGAIKFFGILYPEHDNVVPYVWQMYSDAPEQSALEASKEEPKIAEYSRNANRIKGSCGRSARVHFLGAWDTVSSYGLIKLKTLPGTSKLTNVDIVRHAVAIDEKRNMFPENLVDPNHKNGQEVWFAGVHRDVGGGGTDIGLSGFSMEWMLAEAEAAGLKIDPKRDDKLYAIKPEATAPDNHSLGVLIFFAILGLVPMKWWSDTKKRMTWKWLNLWHVRKIPSDALAHSSVKTRTTQCQSYRPKNLPTSVQYVGSSDLPKVAQTVKNEVTGPEELFH